MLFWEVLACVILEGMFVTGFILAMYDLIKKWKQLHWTQKFYKVVIILGFTVACLKVICLYLNL